MDTNMLRGFHRESSTHSSADSAAITFYNAAEFYVIK